MYTAVVHRDRANKVSTSVVQVQSHITDVH